MDDLYAFVAKDAVEIKVFHVQGAANFTSTVILNARTSCTITTVCNIELMADTPGIFLLDSSMVPNRKFRDFFFDVAREEGVPLQPDVLTGYGEDGAEIQRYDTGRPSVNMTVPTRYLHSHTGMIQRSDFDQAVELLIAVLGRLDDGTVEQIGSFDPR